MSALRKPTTQEAKRYTYADYSSWDDDKRWELINGVPYAMAAPLISHQRVSGRIHRQVSNFLHKKTCEVFLAPTDVRLNADTNDNTVVQPDLLVVCDKSKIGEKGIIGAPDLIMEILSPSSSASYDTVVKFMIYLYAGVREYWIVDPATGSVIVNILNDGTYIAKAYDKTAVVPVSVLEGLSIDLADVFFEAGEE